MIIIILVEGARAGAGTFLVLLCCYLFLIVVSLLLCYLFITCAFRYVAISVSLHGGRRQGGRGGRRRRIFQIGDLFSRFRNTLRKRNIAFRQKIDLHYIMGVNINKKNICMKILYIYIYIYIFIYIEASRTRGRRRGGRGGRGGRSLCFHMWLSVCGTHIYIYIYIYMFYMYTHIYDVCKQGSGFLAVKDMKLRSVSWTRPFK